MAKLLVDMNLSTEWVPLLCAAGHDAVHWSDVGDLDFGTMLALSGDDGPSVVRCVA
jgi:predicted nuclease of predicted toxin-antitoxin system